MSRLTSAQFQQLINNFLWDNFNKAITGDVLRQFIQNLKDSGAEALLKDGTSIQDAITALQNSIPEAGTGGATNESQLKLIEAIASIGLTTDDTQFDYNRVIVSIITALSNALDGKMDKTAITETFEAGPYKPNTAYIYNSAIPEYVSFSNPASDNPDFQVEAWYRLAANATAIQTPETNPEIWIYNGRSLGDIIIGDVLGLTESLNNKLTKPAAAVAGNVPVFNAAGELVDSGSKPGSSAGVHRTISFNSLASILCRDYFKAATSISEIILSGASAIEYSTDNITFTAITLPLAAAITVNGNIWWRITFANGQTTATVTINGLLS